jgi:predicted Rossmann fold nucleotide-binding protein DprA/Smf involved in DNA uptake
MPTVSIIGTAKKFDFEKAYKQAEDYIENFISKDWQDIHLVSGGAAYGDHIAVRLFLAHPESKLSLHLPCKFASKKYEDTAC